MMKGFSKRWVITLALVLGASTAGFAKGGSGRGHKDIGQDRQQIQRLQQQ